MRIIGLTGGIASGKSTVSSMLRDMGATIIDADLIAREVVEVGSNTLNRIAGEFGSSILNTDGSLNRKVLGSIVFKDSVKLAALNSIIHPVIRDVISSRIREAGKSRGDSIVFVDAAVLFESGLDKIVDEVWLVYTDEATQLKRLMLRDKISFDEAAARIKSQMPVEEKIKLSDRVIDNTKDMEYTKRQIADLWNDTIK
jgi:dephospho-CoA kinase